MSREAILRAALETAQVVPRPDDTGLGLVHLGVEQPLAVAGLTQTTAVVSGLTSCSASLLGEPVLAAVTGRPSLVATVAELRGVKLEATWSARDRHRDRRPHGGGEAGDSSQVSPGTLVPLERAPTLHAVSGPLHGLSALFLPVPDLSPSPATWDTNVEVALDALALPGSVDDGGGTGELALEGVLALPPPPSRVVSVPVTLPTLVLPPVLMLSRGTDLQPPATVVVPLAHLGGPAAMLAELASVASRVELVRRLLATAGLRVAAFDAVSRALSALSLLLADRETVLDVQPAEADLGGHGLRTGVDAAATFRSLAYLGLPGQRLSLFAGRSFSGPRLDLEITAEMASPPRGEMVLVIPDLQAVARVEGATTTRGFGYAISSCRLEAYGAVPPLRQGGAKSLDPLTEKGAPNHAELQPP